MSEYNPYKITSDHANQIITQLRRIAEALELIAEDIHPYE
jgi:hypothetical protein